MRFWNPSWGSFEIPSAVVTSRYYVTYEVLKRVPSIRRDKYYLVKLLRYLWGIETFPFLSVSPFLSLLRYLWGFETSVVDSLIVSVVDCYYVTYEVLKRFSSITHPVCFSRITCYYITYEVLKLPSVLTCGTFLLVTTLPMRFWNTVVLSTPSSRGSVIYYITTYKVLLFYIKFLL